MSFLKPDLDYDPYKNRRGYSVSENTAIKQDIEKPIEKYDIEDFSRVLRLFSNNFEQVDLLKLYKNSALTFKTSLNVRDSITFIEKFGYLYVDTLKKTFPNEDFSDVEQLFQIIKNVLDKKIKQVNVENKYMLPVLLGALESLINYKNEI